MNEMDLETQLKLIARRMEFPRTPDIAGHVMSRLMTKPRFARRLAWSLATVLILLSSLFLIPTARAVIVEFIQIGIVRVFPPAETPDIEIPFTAMPVITTATPAQTAEPLIPILSNILGKTTLAEAIKRVGFTLSLPAYPPDLGNPDYAFVQEVDGDMVILVWLDPSNPRGVRLSLHFISNESWVIRKFEPQAIQQTSVNGQPALWTVGPYPLLLANGDIEFTRLIDGHVLIWANEELTYRIESDLSLEEALKVAESFQPIR
jgi:hypothetical protein